MSPPYTLDISVEDGVTVVGLGPAFVNLDELKLDEIRDQLLDIPQTVDPPLLVLDLSNTKFFGSSFIEVLFRIWNRLSARPGGQFVIAGLTPYCAEVLAITHLDKLWRTFPTRADAVQALKPSTTPTQS